MSAPAPIPFRDGPGLAGLLRALATRTPWWRWRISGRTPGDVACSCPDPWPGDEKRGEALLGGEFAFAGVPLRRAGGDWTPERATPAWLEGLHGFAWLRDLRQHGGEPARRRARELVEDWIDNMRGWHPVAWRADVLGARLAAWLGHYEFLGAAREAGFRGKLLGSVVPQLNHLARAAARAPDGGPRLTALKGLVVGACSLAGHDAKLARAQRLLERELARLVLADGMVAERSPAAQLAALMDLVETRGVLQLARKPVPEALEQAIARMAPMLRLLRHGDGGLALFNDTTEGEPWLIDKALSLAEIKDAAPGAAPAGGFQRLAAGRTVVIVDAGAPAAIGARGHAGTLSLEMSHGKERVIVNCGAHPPDGSDWRRAQRATAAHSTLTLDETNSSEVLADGSGLGRRPPPVTATREEIDGRILVDASHEGYVRAFGLLHRRRIYLDETGDDLRGEDTLVGQGKAAFAVRFHLHPKVTASLAQSGEAVLLKLPSGVGWRLRAAGGKLALADTVYLGRPGELRRAQQIVILGDVGPQGHTIKWALRREGKRV